LASWLSWTSKFNETLPPPPQKKNLLNVVISNIGAFTLDVKSVLYENLGGILGGTQMLNGGDSLILSEC
jgi:hypothetical protein